MKTVEQQWFTVADAAKYLGRTRRWVESQLSSGAIKKTVPGVAYCDQPGTTRDTRERGTREITPQAV